MADFRRFYGYGLEHALHLEELERSASRHKNLSAGSRRKTDPARRWLAQTLTALAERIDPAHVSHDSKATHAVS